jgi:ribose transport system ATP-binding protein
VTISDMRRFGRFGFTDARNERKQAHGELKRLNVRPDRPDRLVSELSGGNQQKVVLARWLLKSSKVLLLDEPTRGVDVGAKADVYEVIAELAAGGLGIVMVSSELAELTGFCDRILVMREGVIVSELRGAEATEDDILRHAVRTGGPA